MQKSVYNILTILLTKVCFKMPIKPKGAEKAKKELYMEVTYNAFFYKEHVGGYSVVFPDVQYGATQGETLDEATCMAKDFLEVTLEDFAREDLPKAMPLEKAISHQEKENKNIGYDGELVFVMPITAHIKERCKRINITISEKILKKMDKVASNRSAFIDQAVRDKLKSL